jgi:hypothetical protein
MSILFRIKNGVSVSCNETTTTTEANENYTEVGKQLLTFWATKVSPVVDSSFPVSEHVCYCDGCNLCYNGSHLTLLEGSILITIIILSTEANENHAEAKKQLLKWWATVVSPVIDLSLFPVSGLVCCNDGCNL